MRRALLALVLLMLLLPAGASAASDELPICWNNQAYGRAELTRTTSLYCPRTSAAELVTRPAHGTLTDVVFASSSLQFDYRADADAPEEDSFTVRLTGSTGSVIHRIPITVTPRSVNTPPWCPPESLTERTDGVTRPVLEFQVQCYDAEHDDFVVTGSGPGEFLNTPLTYDPIFTTRLRYRTAVVSGQEQASYTATDDLGAASKPAPISVAVGAAVDRLPSCRPNPSGDPENPVHTRPGATRRFAIICTDADADPFTQSIREAPTRGRITAFVPGFDSGFGGLERFMDTTYVPTDSFEGDDRFVVGAEGARGRGPDRTFAMRSRPRPDNFGGGCGYSPAYSQAGASVTVSARCSDDDGDPLEAQIIRAPSHGVAEPPVVSEAPFGDTLVAVRYTPIPGYEGPDDLAIRVDDGNGSTSVVDLEVISQRSGQYTAPPPIYLTPPTRVLAPQPSGGPFPGASGLPAVGQEAPRSERAQAERALGTSRVRRVRQLGDASVYAPRDPVRVSGRRGLAVTCATGCAISATTKLVVAKRRTKSRKARANATAGRPASLPLRLSRQEKRLATRSRRARLRYRLTVTPRAGARASASFEVKLHR